MDLGFPVDEKHEDVTFFKLSNIKFAVLDRNFLQKDTGVTFNENGYSPCNLCHMVNSEREVDEVMEQVIAAGAKVVRAAGKAIWGGYSGFFKDPDNNLWEIGFEQSWKDVS